MMDELTQRFRSMLADKGIRLESRQLEQFELYYRELITWNENINLTGITERDQVYIKHFFDSLSLSFFVPIKEVGSLIDIGSGAGFPSLPLKIAFPHLRITIVDSLNKRIKFLQHIVQQLGLDHVNCVHSRAEDAARDVHLRNRFDVATARAVARLNVLNELCSPFVRKNGFFVAMKGADNQDEVHEAAHSMKELKLQLSSVHSFDLPVDQGRRQLILMRKAALTPVKYPRKAGIPSKQPL